MRAVVITRHGGPEVLQVQERPDPPVGPGQVRIAVKAAGINFADTLARTGLYQDSPKVPCVWSVMRWRARWSRWGTVLTQSSRASG
jgi:NADPH:quinone reductase-like Zn-dependent oxidoreductase